MLMASGKSRPIVWAARDVWAWHPRYGNFQSFLGLSGKSETACDFVGFLYSPMIGIDRRFVHRSIETTTDDCWDKAPPEKQWHPIFRQNGMVAREVWKKYEGRIKALMSAGKTNDSLQVVLQYYKEVKDKSATQ